MDGQRIAPPNFSVRSVFDSERVQEFLSRALLSVGRSAEAGVVLPEVTEQFAEVVEIVCGTVDQCMGMSMFFMSFISIFDPSCEESLI